MPQGTLYNGRIKTQRSSLGVFERIEDEKLSVCKVTFGAEPKDYEVLEFVLKNYCQLKFSSSVDVKVRKKFKSNASMI